MIWNAAGFFTGRPAVGGAGCRATSCCSPACSPTREAGAGLVLKLHFVSVYTFLTAAELWRERRKRLLRAGSRFWCRCFTAAAFCPIPLASLLPPTASRLRQWVGGRCSRLETISTSSAWLFIVLALARSGSFAFIGCRVDRRQDRLLNRPASWKGARILMVRQTLRGRPVSVLMFTSTIQVDQRPPWPRGGR